MTNISNAAALIILFALCTVQGRIMYTYSHRNVTDQALASFWKDSWTKAGWQPVILTEQQAKSHPEYTNLQQQLPKDIHPYFFKWLAMAQVGGGWMCELDVFPLREFNSQIDPHANLTVYQTVAPTLVAGSAQAYQYTVTVMIEYYRTHQFNTFWTDTLGLVQLRHENNAYIQWQRRVASGDKDPTQCRTRALRKAYVVEFGVIAMQRSAKIPAKWRLPKHRVTWAQNWLPLWEASCSDGEDTS